jgi:hypothetical protein
MADMRTRKWIWTSVAAGSLALAGVGWWGAKFLIRYSPPVYAKPFEEREVSEALVRAASEGNDDAVAALLAKGVSPDSVVRSDDTEGDPHYRPPLERVMSRPFFCSSIEAPTSTRPTFGEAPPSSTPPLVGEGKSSLC